MTYDPDRDARTPSDINPHARPYRGGSMGMGMLLGLLALLILGGLLFYATQDGDQVASDTRPGASAPATTGSGSSAPAPSPSSAPAPKTPAPAR